MRKLVIPLTLFVFGWLFPIVGQNDIQDITDSEVMELITANALEICMPENNNIAFIQQIGNDHNATALQENTGWGANIIHINQNGEGNIGYIEQTGSAHAAFLTQAGSGNEANLWSAGHHSLTVVVQNGTGNFINSYIDNRGIIPKGAILSQEGSSNRIDFALLGNGLWKESWPKAAIIKQTGNELEVSAIFDSYQYPVYVEQQSGANGGMKVDVSTSAFYFPMKK